MTVMHVKKTRDSSVEKIKEGLSNPKSQSPLNLVIDADLHKRFKIKTTMDGISMTDVVTTAIIKYLSE